MFGFVHCNASILARQNTDPNLFFVRTLVKNWLWPIITFFGVTGNILVIIVLTKRRMIMSSTNNYLVALALVDLAYLILTLILNTLQNPCFTNTSLSEIVLTICRPIADFASNASVWLTVTFTVERWVAITYPLQSRTWCTIHRARKIILSVICASLLCTLPSAFEMKLVRISERRNVLNKIIYTSYIQARPTALGKSLLYHQIYFNFVTFAIVWIPLLLLLIFNTILICYVRRSKQNTRESKEGIQLRRHSRGNQSEQRKTTIMLIAVVIVFTVCQIPQAISLTVQSFFPKLAQTSKVLIYNNFANCLVAVNASINFVLFCCFSDRFRSTFRSSFTFLSKYCAHFIQPNWKIKSNHHRHTFSNSLDDVSSTNQSNYSIHRNQIDTRISTRSNDINPKYLSRINQNQSRLKEEKNNSLLAFRLAIFSSKLKLTPLQEGCLSQNTELLPTSPTTNLIKSPLVLLRQPPTSNVSTDGDRTTLKSPIDKTTVTVLSSIPSTHHSFSSHGLNAPISKSRFHPKSSSYRSFSDNDKNQEQIWIKRHQSEQFLNRPKSFHWNEIIDVTV